MTVPDGYTGERYFYYHDDEIAEDELTEHIDEANDEDLDDAHENEVEGDDDPDDVEEESEIDELDDLHREMQICAGCGEGTDFYADTDNGIFCPTCVSDDEHDNESDDVLDHIRDEIVSEVGDESDNDDSDTVALTEELADYAEAEEDDDYWRWKIYVHNAHMHTVVGPENRDLALALWQRRGIDAYARHEDGDEAKRVSKWKVPRYLNYDIDGNYYGEIDPGDYDFHHWQIRWDSAEIGELIPFQFSDMAEDELVEWEQY